MTADKERPYDPTAFISENLTLKPAPGIPEISLYQAHPASRISRLAGDVAPYWAYGWAGGTVLARYILDHTATVKAWRGLDLGAGSGIVAIAAMQAGAASVLAVDTDPNAIAAIALNAGANGVAITTLADDITGNPPPDVDLILAGDVFYHEHVAAKMIPFLDRCHAAGIAILIGDPGRTPLPLGRLRAVADYHVPDFGDATAVDRPSFVYTWS